MRCSESSLNAVKSERRPSHSLPGHLRITATAASKRRSKISEELREYVEIVAAAHHNEAEVGLAKARDGGGADAIFEMIASSAAITAFAMTQNRDRFRSWYFRAYWKKLLILRTALDLRYLRRRRKPSHSELAFRRLGMVIRVSSRGRVARGASGPIVSNVSHLCQPETADDRSFLQP